MRKGKRQGLGGWFFNLIFISYQNIADLQCCITSKWESESCSVMSDSLRPHGLYSSWSSPGQNTGVGSLSLLQGIFLTQR